MRTTQFNRLVQLSPYPVKIEEIETYNGYFRWGDGKNAGRPYSYTDFKPRIAINKDIAQSRQVAALLHEIGHAMHYRRHCKCFMQYAENKVLREFHAERFALRFMLRYELIGALRSEIHSLKMDINNKQYICDYWKSMIILLQQDKIWHKCKNYLTRPTG